MDLGRIVILNGAPRSGKTSIAHAIQRLVPGTWINMGVDAYMKMTPEHLMPGIGLRPGGERPDLEPVIEAMYFGLYRSIAAHSQAGLDVVVDVGHHGSYATIRNPLFACARLLEGCPALLIGVKCPLDEILIRRSATNYLSGTEVDVPAPILLWQEAVHDPGIYDFEVDTSRLSPGECVEAISNFDGEPSAIASLAKIA